MSNAVSLYELTASIRLAIARALPQTYWVRAEISEGRRNINGHFYCKFIEKNAAGQDIASANGIIWAGTYNIIKARFERETGQALAAGIKVLVNVKVNFHERYGLSLVVNDIDPSYTLGDMVRRRKHEQGNCFASSAHAHCHYYERNGCRLRRFHESYK